MDNEVIGYIPTRWKVYEVVDKATYERLGVLAWNLIDEKLRKFIDGLSIALEAANSRHITLICNNWMWHKNPDAQDYFQWRGLRTKDYRLYSRTSYHGRKICRALDMHSPDMSANELRIFVINNKDAEWCKDIGGIELGVNWLHADTRTRLLNNRLDLFKA